jgi:photoactive yellow protein
MMDFGTSALRDLDGAASETLDVLPFGIIGFGPDGVVDRYSATESRLAGLSPDRVLGKHVFTAVAPCMNNYMVAQRFDDEPELDATIDYVLTLRMKPTPVKLRLLKSKDAGRRYILVQR